jgi:hypothetical protein
LRNDSRPVIANEAKQSRRYFRQKNTPFTRFEAWFLACFVALLLAMMMGSEFFNCLIGVEKRHSPVMQGEKIAGANQVVSNRANSNFGVMIYLRQTSIFIVHQTADSDYEAVSDILFWMPFIYESFESSVVI